MRYPSPRLPTRWALVAGLLASAACGVADPRQPDDAAPLLATLAAGSGSGADRLRAGDLAGARATFEGTLASRPDQLGPLNDLAISYLLEGHAEAARRLLDEVVAAGGAREQQAALVNLGELYALEGYHSAARAYLETARGIDPTWPGAWYALALLADVGGETATARTLLREALRLDEGGAARAELAYVYPEERAHLEALIAELAGDAGVATARWRDLSAGSFAALAAAAERHLAGE